MKKLINNYLRYFGYQIKKVKFINPQEDFLRTNYNLDMIDFEKLDNKFYSKKLDILMENKDFETLLGGYDYALLIKSMLGATFKYDRNNRLICEMKDKNLRFYINSSEELFIIKEVFIDGIYNVKINDKKRIQIVDIGMNVGITSLFFANRPNVEKIIGFEPFGKTYKLSQDNFNVNKHISSKIKGYNFGISNSDNREKWIYNFKYKGSVGCKGLGKHIHVPAEEISEEWIKLIDIRKIFNEYIIPQRNLTNIVKIDCEGSEYEIIKALSEDDLLRYADIFLIEWHNQGPDSILKNLVESNFTCLSFKSALDIGMVYAFSPNS